MYTQNSIRGRFRHCSLVIAVCALVLSESLPMAQETNNKASDVGVASMTGKDLAKAISDYGETIKRNPKDAVAYECRGGAYFANGDLEHAIRDFTEAIQLDPQNARAFCNRGTAYRAKGEFKPAIRDLSEALRLCPTNDFAYMQRASVYNVTGQFERAIADWSAGLSLKPEDATARAMRGFAYSKKGEYEKAVSDYREAIRLDPSNHPAYNDLGWLRATCPKAEMRNGKEAVVDATKACELTQWIDWTRVDTLAAALAEVGDFPKAVDYQKRAMKMSGASKEGRADMQVRLVLYERQEAFREKRQ